MKYFSQSFVNAIQLRRRTPPLPPTPARHKFNSMLSAIADGEMIFNPQVKGNERAQTDIKRGNRPTGFYKHES